MGTRPGREGRRGVGVLEDVLWKEGEAGETGVGTDGWGCWKKVGTDRSSLEDWRRDEKKKGGRGKNERLQV